MAEESKSRESGEGSGERAPDASSTAITAGLERCTLQSTSSLPRSLLRLGLRLKIDQARAHRPSVSAAEAEDESEVPCGHDSDPRLTSFTPSRSVTQPIRRRTVSNERRRRLRPHTTWHLSTGHWTWTSPALRTRRCVAFAEKEDRDSKRRVTTDATLELHRANAKIDRLRRRIEVLENRRDYQTVRGATQGSHASQETVDVTVEEASPPQQTSHQRPCQLPAAQPSYAVPSTYYTADLQTR